LSVDRHHLRVLEMHLLSQIQKTALRS
jgi:hypothetical protein